MTPPTAAQIEAALRASESDPDTARLRREIVDALARAKGAPFWANSVGIEIGMRIAQEMPKLGATGKFPQGHAAAEDEGELVFAIAADREHGIVRVEFGTSVAWMGLPPLQAKELALKLMQKAQEVETGWMPSTPV